MSELLLEILCEEIPARMQVKAGADLVRMLSDTLTKAGLAVGEIQSFTGPRRLVFVADVPARSPDVKEERKGPRVGSPEQALAGFMRGAGLTDISQAETRSDKKGEHYVAVIEKPGRDAGDIIAEVVPEVMAKFPWPKSMKSGASTFRWVRPLTSILCLLDGKVVPFTVAGIDSGNITHGHRRMGAGPFTVAGFKAYKQTLENKGHVILSADERKEIILRDAKAVCEKADLELVEDIGLLNEVAGLAEWPTVLLGDMDPAFLKLPPEVIKLSMRTHQKYFSVQDKGGNLAAKFVVVANQVAPDGGVEIAKGNARVLSARLDDARFFEQEDAKRTLESRFDELDGVVFHQKLGSIKDKAERVAALARELAPKVGADPDKAEKAARLAKCDLVTNMVVEFTSLQGKIGRLMYKRENELGSSVSHPTPSPSPSRGGEQDPNPPSPLWGGTEGGGSLTKDDHADIARAIEDHYKPVGASDSVPTNPVAVAVALADKLDTLVGFWAIDEKPTGSKDPFALRRAALGVVRIAEFVEQKTSIRALINCAAFLHKKQLLKNFIKDNDLFVHTHLVAFEPPGKSDSGDVTLNIDLRESKLVLPNESVCVLVDSEEQAAVFRSKHDLIFAFSEVSDFYDVKENLYLAKASVEPYFFSSHPDEELIKVRRSVGEIFHSESIVKGFVQTENLLYFILDRLQVHLRDEGVSHDHIDAVFALGGDDLVDITNRVKALGTFLSTDDGANLLAGYKRAVNILKAEAKKGDLPDAQTNAGTQPEEGALFSALATARPLIEKALADEDYAGAMTALAGLRAPIDAFFDDVTVNSDVAAERENRLGLLMQVRSLAGTIADFEKVEG